MDYKVSSENCNTDSQKELLLETLSTVVWRDKLDFRIAQAITVVFFKLDRGDSFLEGKMTKITALIEMTAVYMKTMMVYWVRHWAATW